MFMLCHAYVSGAWVSDNVKAFFRRAKAHTGAWNPDAAIEDYKQVLELDSSLEKTCNKEIQAIMDMKKKKDAEDRAKLQGKMFTS